MRIAITNHAKERIQKRLKINDGLLELADQALASCEKMNAIEIKRFKKEWCDNFIYKKYIGFVWVFQLRRDVVLITVIKGKKCTKR